MKRNIGKPFQDQRAARQAAEQRGRVAEDKVAAAWKADGYAVLARRLRTGAGELDLVVADEQRLVFIEVKCRRDAASALGALAEPQQRRLLQAADIALAQHAEWQRPETRFDVAFVSAAGIHHVPDALRQF